MKLKLIIVVAVVNCVMLVDARWKGFWIDNRTEDQFVMTQNVKNAGLDITEETDTDVIKHYEIPGKTRIQYFFRASTEYAPLPDNEDSLLFKSDRSQFSIVFWESDGNCYLRFSHENMVTDHKVGYNIRYVGDYDKLLYGGGNVIDIISDDAYRITHCYKRWNGRTNIVVENITDDDSWLKEVSLYDEQPSTTPSRNKHCWSKLLCCCDCDD